MEILVAADHHAGGTGVAGKRACVPGNFALKS